MAVPAERLSALSDIHGRITQVPLRPTRDNTQSLLSPQPEKVRSPQGERGAKVLEGYWATPDWRAREIERLREHGREMMDRMWADPEKREAELQRRRGRILSDDTKRAMSDSHNTEESKRKKSEANGGIRIRAYKYLLRDISNQDTATYTGDELHKIKNLRFRLRDNGELPKPTAEEVSAALSRSQRGKPRNSRGREYTENEQREIELVKQLDKAQLITEDLTAWNELKEMYAANDRELPEHSALQLRAEVFYQAVKETQGGSDGMMALYISLLKLSGLPLEPTQEEEFIGQHLKPKSNIDVSESKQTHAEAVYQDETEAETQEESDCLIHEQSSGFVLHPVDPRRSIRSRIHIEDINEEVEPEDAPVNGELVKELATKDHDRLVRFAVTRTNSPDEAEDLVQKVYERMLQSETQYIIPEGRSPSTLAVTIMLNLIRDNARRRNTVSQKFGRQVELNEREKGPEDVEIHTMKKLETESLVDALNTLPEDTREMLLLHYIDEVPLRDIGEMVDKSHGAVKSIFFRARNEMRGLLIESEEEIVASEVAPIRAEDVTEEIVAEAVPEVRISEALEMPINVDWKHDLDRKEEKEAVKEEEVDVWINFGNLVNLWTNTYESNRFTRQVINKRVIDKIRAGEYGDLPEDRMELQAFIGERVHEEVDAMRNTPQREQSVTIMGERFPRKPEREKPNRSAEKVVWSYHPPVHASRAAAMEVHKK